MGTSETFNIEDPFEQMKLLQAIEFVHFKMLDVWTCPRCGGAKPDHQEACELKAWIESDRQVREMMAEEDAERAANPEIEVREARMNWRRFIFAELNVEREHQINDNGYTDIEDDGYENGELARAAAAMLLVGSLDERDRAWFDPEAPATARSQYGSKLVERVRALWPFPNLPKWKGQRRDLIRGLAMGVAELERLHRINMRGPIPDGDKP